MKNMHTIIVLVCIAQLLGGFVLVSAVPVDESSDHEKIAVYGLRSGTYLTQSTYSHQADIIQQRWKTPPKEIIRLPEIFLYAGIPFFFCIFLYLFVHFLVALESEQRKRRIQKPWTAFD
tara:strand:+ start:351 stop:707 length:357 start_codon:yes stop_codon:yes gene_type:complete